MNSTEVKARFGENLTAIESLSENAHAHYLRVENAVARTNLAELQEHYAYLHGMLPEDAVADRRFPWHPQYKYGDGKKCCADCEELEMALGVNIINAGQAHPLTQSLPEFAALASEAAIA